MKKLKTPGMGALVGGLLTAPLMAVMYLTNQWPGLPFVPYDLFNWITRVLPGPVVTFGIDLMIDTLILLGLDVADVAKTAERATAILQFFVIGVVVSALFFWVIESRRTKGDRAAGFVIGALFGLPMAGISLAITQSEMFPIFSFLYILALFLAWGVGLSWAYGRLQPTAEAETAVAGAEKIDRRQFLIRLGASTATITVIGAGVGTLLSAAERRRQEETETIAHESDETPRQLFPNADDPVIPVPGTRPEYTPVKDHYQVFLQTEPTVIDGSTWKLPITGLVGTPLMLTLDDLRNDYESRDQYVTLNCISGRVGTTLISTTLWTGVSVQDVLATAQVRPEAKYLHIKSGDGFYETVALDLINSDKRIMFCYAWDGNTLPVDHGFPLRIWIPDRFGMKQPKWITSIEVTSEYIEGYWVERGWDEVAQVKTTSVVDTVAVDHIMERGGQQYVPVGGIAWGGDRQISKVEVRVDGSPWETAELRTPLSETTWVIWRYEWPFQAGHHTFEVRCAEGDGTPQIEEPHPARPDGSTGVHSREADL